MSLMENESLTLKRRASGSYVSGHYVQGSESTSTIYANVQPLSGEQILQLPEADRKKEGYSLFSEDEMRVNDIIVRDSKNYEIQTVYPYQNQPIPHYEGVMIIIEGQ